MGWDEARSDHDFLTSHSQAEAEEALAMMETLNLIHDAILL